MRANLKAKSETNKVDYISSRSDGLSQGELQQQEPIILNKEDEKEEE